MEKRHNYVRKVAETAVQLFVSNDKVNVAGMVLAGSADFKTELSQSDMFDPVSVWTIIHLWFFFFFWHKCFKMSWLSIVSTFELQSQQSFYWITLVFKVKEEEGSDPVRLEWTVESEGIFKPVL